ncbi:MAG: tyrosine-type recombinase/integrase [Lewinella sp.]|nr:tyrosine-type recombinase/integrase [Lewinella sp.]
MSTTLAIRLEKSKNAKNKEGKYPIILQVTHNRQARSRRLGVYAYEHQFSILKDTTTRREKVLLSSMNGVKEKQQYIDEQLEKAQEIYREHFEDKKEFSFQEFFSLFSQETKQEVEGMKVAQFCQVLSKEFLSSNQVKSAEDYKYTGVAVLKVAPNDISFNDFDEVFLGKLKQYFIDKGVKGFNHFVRLRAVYTQAIERRYVTQDKYPFKNKYLNPFGFDINKIKKLRVSGANPNRIKDMFIQDIIELYQYEHMTETEKKMIKGYWFFSFFNFGVNLTDIARLKYKHLKEMRWFYGRNKTGIGLKRGKPLLEEAIEIIKEYGRFGLAGDGEEYVFDIIPGKNASEEEIVKAVSLYTNRIRHACVRVSKKMEKTGYFTFMSARYSAITLALNEGADRNTVSHLADHANFSTLDHYAGRADDEKVVKAMQTLSLKERVK